MSPFLKTGLKWALALGAGVGVLYTYQTLKRELRGDPLARFRAPVRGDLPEELGLRLDDVRIRRYVGKKIETEFRVARVDVAKNRQVFDLTGIKNGVYRSDKTSFRFAAGKGRWNGYSGVLNLDGGIKARNDDFALTTADLLYESRPKILRLTGQVSGDAYGGDLKADRVVFDMTTETFTAGPVSWKGKLSQRLLTRFDPQAKISPALTRSEWDIQAALYSTRGTTTTFSDAEAKDGEVIVRAPQVSLDRPTDVITATGGVRYFSGRMNLVARKATIIRRERRAIFEGDVRMLVKTKAEEAKGPVVEELPKYIPLSPEKVAAGKALPDPKDIERVRNGKSVRDYPLVIVADKVDSIYERGRRVANIFGSPQARQELGGGAWRQVWTHTARFDAENDLLRLQSAEGKSDARLKNSIGDDLLAKIFELSTKEGDDEYSGQDVRGSVVSTDENDPRKTPGAKSPAKTTKAAPPKKAVAKKPAVKKPGL